MTEFLDGVELFDFITKKSFFTEKEVCKLISQILSAIFYLHQKNIIHRDLKPENIVFEKVGNEEMNLKLIDFGTSRKIHKNEKLHV